MSFEVNKFEVVKKTKLGRENFAVSFDVETQTEFEKVLSVKSNIIMENYEVLNGIVSFSGKIDACIVYQTVDQRFETEKQTVSFSSKIEEKDAKAGDLARIFVGIENCKVDVLSQNKLRLDYDLVSGGVLISKREVEKVTASDENICQKFDEIEVEKFLGRASETFVVDCEETVKNHIKQIIMSDSAAFVKTIDSGVDFVSVGGEVATKLLYVNEDDKIETVCVVENFKEEIELAGATRESLAQVDLQVMADQIKLEYENDEKSTKIKMQIPVEMTVYGFGREKKEIISDVYSTKTELKTTTSSFDMTKNLETEFFETKIEGQLSLDEDKPRVDKLIFVGMTNLNVTNSYIKDGEVFVEGIAKTGVVYLNDETNGLYGVDIEVPFIATDKVKVECESANVQVCAVVASNDVVVKKGRDFYFDAKVNFKVEYDCNEYGAVISNIENGADLPEQDGAIEIYYAREGQNAWDVAKSLKVDEQTLYSQNPELIFPLDKEQNIVLFHQKRT